jgi:hypothetical protein
MTAAPATTRFIVARAGERAVVHVVDDVENVIRLAADIPESEEAPPED